LRSVRAYKTVNELGDAFGAVLLRMLLEARLAANMLIQVPDRLLPQTLNL
jgi:hypothetical protein